MLREVLPFKTAANNLHGHKIKHELMLDDLGGFRFSVKTDSLLDVLLIWVNDVCFSNRALMSSALVL